MDSASLQRRREARREYQETKHQRQQQERDERRQIREGQERQMHRYLHRLHQGVRAHLVDLSDEQERELLADLQARVATQSFASMFGYDSDDGSP